MSADKFEFKKFSISQSKCAMKVGTDAVLLGSWVTVENETTILDIGTGTGVIAIMLAQKSNAQITAVDIDAISIDESVHNISNSPWSDRINAIHSSIQEFAKQATSKFDLIVSNPPYFIDAYKSQEVSRNQARHTDQLPYSDFIQCAKDLLQPNGRLCLILPTKESLKFRELAAAQQFYLTKITHVKTTQYKEEKRQLLQFELINKKLQESSLIIEENERHSYSEEYKLLTKDFYLSF